VLEEAAGELFTLAPGACYDFMSYAAPVNEDKRDLLGATTHVDGTARVQTVSRARNPLFWRLIQAFGQRTGVPALLNTSFNNNYEPIVDSVEDAVVCFLTTGLDGLVVGNHLVRKKAVCPETWLSLAIELPADHLLAQGRERHPGGADGDGFTAIHSPAGRLVPVSAALARCLAGGAAGHSIAETLAGWASASGDGCEAADLVAELRALWEKRLIVAAPRTRGGIAPQYGGQVARSSASP
jgi:carbamoyltransferase